MKQTTPSSKPTLFALTMTASFLVGSIALVPTASAAQLLAAWEFNPSDVSGSSISATAGSSANTTGLLIADAAIVGDVLTLDGDGDYLEFGNDLVELRSHASMTIAAWVQTNSPVTANRRIVEHEDNTYFWAENGIFQYTTHGTPGGTGGRALSTSAPAVGTWQHVLVTFTSGQPANIYLDGVLEGTSAVAQGAVPNNLQTFQIGARRSNSGPASNFWDGLIDDVALWEGELSQAEIDQLAGVGNGGYPGRATPAGLEEDCNGDGIPDIWYEQFSLDPCDANIGMGDPDGDTLLTSEEFAFGTNPTEADSDGDGLPDNEELSVHNTDPTVADSDDDGLLDGAEITLHSTDPNDPDSDDDGLTDGAEVEDHATLPNDPDSDDDGFSDGQEIAANTDPLDEFDFPRFNLGSDLFLYFPFDDSDIEGDTIRDRAENPAGPFDGVRTNGGPATGVAGMFGEAAEFLGGANNGDWEFVDLSTHAAALAALGEGTIGAWVRTPADSLATDVLTIFALSDQSAGSVESRYWISNGGAFGTGTLAYGTRGGASPGALNTGATNPLLDGEWHHVAITFTAADSTARLYIDGTEAASGSSSFLDDIPNANSASIGRNKDSTAGGGQWFFDGAMDDFAIWTRPLNAGEVSFLYNEGLAGNPIGAPSAVPFEITDITYGPAPDTVSITFNSRPGQSYSAKFSTDMLSWEEIDDPLATESSTTIIDDFIPTGRDRVFYRVEIAE